MRKIIFLVSVGLLFAVSQAFAVCPQCDGTAITLDTEIADSIANSEIKYYQFDTTSKGLVKVNLRHQNLGTGDNRSGWRVELHADDASFTLISSFLLGNTTGVNYSLEGLAPGHYYLKIFKDAYYGVIDDTYFLTVSLTPDEFVETSPHDSKNTANTIPINQEIKGNMFSSSAQSSDYYQFDIPANGQVKVNLRHDKVDAGDDRSGWRVELHADDASFTLISSFLLGNKTGENWSLEGLAPGHYYLKIFKDAYYGVVDDMYFLTVSFTADNFFEISPHDSKNTANTIPINQEIKGNMFSSSAQSLDYYQFDIPANGQVEVKLRHDKTDAGDNRSGWWVELHADDASFTLISSFLLGNKTGIQTSIKGISAGHYYIKIFMEAYYGVVNDPYFLTVSLYDTSVCPEKLTYAQNPTTLRWVIFPTECDLPYGWDSQFTVPANFIHYVFTSDERESYVITKNNIITGLNAQIGTMYSAQQYNQLTQEISTMFTDQQVADKVTTALGQNGLHTEAEVTTMVQNILQWGDINGDGKIGLEEAVKALRTVSGSTAP